MANREHLEILKQGVDVWNMWRDKYQDIRPDLSEADLSGAGLINANLLVAHLRLANLSGADLRLARLLNTNLNGADVTNAHFWNTAFAGIDLNLVKGLDRAIHEGPSTIHINSIVLPIEEQIRSHFLQGIGFTQAQIEYLPSRPILYHSLFISYAHQDEALAKRLYTDLRKNSVLCWFAPEDMKIGDKIRSQIDKAIRIHDKLLLVLSKSSVESDWVEKEVEMAFEKEGLDNIPVLFPIRLDNAVMTTTKSWAADIRRSRHIGDFRNWKNHDDYLKAFNRLLRDLKAEVPSRL